MRKLRIFFIIQIFIESIIFAGAPKLLNYTITPPNPGWGDLITIDANFCLGEYTQHNLVLIAVSQFNTPKIPSTAGQIFYVYGRPQGNNIVGVPWLGPDATSGDSFGYDLGDGPQWADPKNCTDCGGSQGWTVNKKFTFTMPSADEFPDCNVTSLYILIRTELSYLSKTQWTDFSDACKSEVIPITIGVPPRDFNIHKRIEGTIAANTSGDLVLISIDYEYGDGQLRITDVVPSGLKFLQAGPKASVTSQPPAGSSGGTIQWDLPDRSGVPGISRGTVWFLCESDSLPAGTVINNTAQARLQDAPQTPWKQSTASLTVGQVSMTLKKSQSTNQINQGDIITYYLDYEINGMQLKFFESFDQFSLGQVFNQSTGPPPRWRFLPYGAPPITYGTWTIIDPCSTGDNYIKGAAPSNQQYPGMLLDDGDDSSPVDDYDYFCTGMIVTDVKIEQAQYSGSDAQVIIRHNGETSTSLHQSISLILSIDQDPGYVAFQVINRGSNSPQYPARITTNTPGIVGNKWFRVRIFVEQIGNDYRYSAKVWPRGEPEPSSWTLQWTQTGAAISDEWRCDDPSSGSSQWNKSWRPGVNEQRGDDVVEDAYDNFTVYRPRFSSGATLRDDVPPGVTYAGCNGGCLPPGADVNWSIPNGSLAGSYTWWGTVDCSQEPNHITNTARIVAGSQTVYSNVVSLDVLCATNTPTNTPTITNTRTPTNTPTNTPTFTSTNTPTNTFTPTYTNTVTNTRTNTPTNTITNTRTNTQTNTETYTSTDTNTPTYTMTNTPTFSFTNTRTDTMTNTITNTRTNTATNTLTNTPTDTWTQTYTPTLTWTGTPPPTWTPTNTWTNTNTPTNTFTQTNTWTFTNTLTNTNTPTETSTGTPPPTWTPTNTLTNTNTSTNTFTPTNTNPPTDTNTPTNTNSPTNTWTLTNTWTNTNTPTNTNSPTNTYTPTYTFTRTNTATDTYTPTNTYTPTDTPTQTATPTITMTLPPFPYIIKIGIYNSAGEQVKTVIIERASDQIGEIKLINNGNEVNLIKAGDKLEIILPGIETPKSLGQGQTSFYWDGTNDSGQNVKNGTYYIKIEEKDGYGHTNVLIKDISVINIEEYVELNIFNSAGEKVKTIKENKYFTPEKVNLKVQDMIILEKENNNIVINYGEEIGAYVIWNGQDSSGKMVSNGTYEIQVVVRTSDGKLKYASKTVIILNEMTEYFKNVKVYPNPYVKNEVEKITFSWDSSYSGDINIYVYNLSGELIRKITGKLEDKKFIWDLKTADGKTVSPGNYISVIYAKNLYGYSNKEVIKFSIIKK